MSERTDDDIEDCDDAVDNGHEDGADGVDDGHDAAADGLEDACDLVGMLEMRLRAEEDWTGGCLRRIRRRPLLRCLYDLLWRVVVV